MPRIITSPPELSERQRAAPISTFRPRSPPRAGVEEYPATQRANPSSCPRTLSAHQTTHSPFEPRRRRHQHPARWEEKPSAALRSHLVRSRGRSPSVSCRRGEGRPSRDESLPYRHALCSLTVSHAHVSARETRRGAPWSRRVGRQEPRPHCCPRGARPGVGSPSTKERMSALTGSGASQPER